MFSRLCPASLLRISAVFWLANLAAKFRFALNQGPLALAFPAFFPGSGGY